MEIFPIIEPKIHQSSLSSQKPTLAYSLNQFNPVDIFRTYSFKIYFNIFIIKLLLLSRESSVRILTRLPAGQSRNQGSIPGRDKIYFFYPHHPDHLRDKSSLLSNEHRGFILRYKVPGM
jgi:hypothetical protein